MNNEKNTTLAIVLVIGLALIAYSVWVTVTNRNRDPNTGGEGVVCTMDAFQCPDGSWVGRTGPSCEFVCPAGTSTSPTGSDVSLVGGIGEKLTGLDVTIIPMKVEEDSRCPVGVQCIQAGTVRVTATVVSGLGTSTPLFTMDRAITTEAESIVLIGVTPEPKVGEIISPEDYRFTFRVVKR